MAKEPTVFRDIWAKESAVNSVPRPMCECLEPQYGDRKWAELQMHIDPQDSTAPGWTRLLELIDEAARDGREEFSPGREMSPEQWTQVVTLPPSIAKLKAVKHFILYGSSLVSIPPEIGQMESLEQFTPYTSYRLHWFPYEITRCSRLRRSTVSTRALYGNRNYGAPFPRLPQAFTGGWPPECSVCGAAFSDQGPLQYWTSLGVATDVLPLLIHVCSKECLSRVPPSADGHTHGPHRGGLGSAAPAELT